MVFGGGPLRPLVQSLTVFKNLFHRARDVVHVLPATEEQGLGEPDALLMADEVAVRTTCPGIVQPVGSRRQERAEGLVSKQRLMGKGQRIARRARDALGLQGLEDGGARRAKFGLVQSQQEQV